MSEDPHQFDHSRYGLVAASSFILQTWLFRTLIVMTAFLTVALCNWLIKDSAAPLAEASAVAAGLILGFGIMHLVETAKRKTLR